MLIYVVGHKVHFIINFVDCQSKVKYLKLSFDF